MESSNNSNEDSTDDSMSMKETTEEVKYYSRKSSKLFDLIINSQMDIDEKNNLYSSIKKELQVKMILLINCCTLKIFFTENSANFRKRHNLL